MKIKFSRITALLLAFILLFSAVTPVFASSSADTLVISSADDLLDLAQKCSLDTWSKGKTVSLKNDISLEGVDFRSIPSFGGTFYGNGHTISGLELTDTAYPSGLFGVLQEGAVIQDLNVSGAVIPSGDKNHVGGIVGENHGTVQNCTFTGTVIGDTYTGGIVGHNSLTGSVKGCKTAGEVVGKNMTGGIVGYNEGAVSQCENGSLVNTISIDPSISLSELNTLFTADLGLIPTFDTLNVASDTGGIVGYSSGMILGCVNNATVGYAHVGYNVGGIAGRSCGHLANCRNHGAVYGRKEVGGIAGQMEPHISLNLTVDYIAQLKTELDALQQMINHAADRADGESAAISSRLNSIGGLIGSASASAKDLSDQVVDLGEETVTEVNRGSEILDETISQLSGIADQFPAMSEKITLGLDQLENAVNAMAAASEMGTAALADMKLAAEDAAEAISLSRTASNMIGSGVDKLSNALVIHDKAAAKEALGEIADGLSDMVDAVQAMSDAADALIAVLRSAGWTEDGVKQIKALSVELQAIGGYLSDIHDAVTAIEENIEVDWEKFTEGSRQLLDALGYFSAASQKFDEAMVLAESGIGKITSGIEQILGAVSAEDPEAVDAALAQITVGFQELRQSASDASAAMDELSNALSGIEGLEDVSAQMDSIVSATAKISQAGQSAAVSLGKIAEALSIISENVEIVPGNAEGSAALALEGFDEILASIEALREAAAALDNGLTLLRQGLSNLNTAVEIQDEAAMRAALGEIHTALGNIAGAIENIGIIMEEMAGTLDEMRLWGDSLTAAAGKMAAAFSDFSDALSKVQNGVDVLRNTVTLDPDSATAGLSEIRDGLKLMVSASVALENSIGHFYDSLADMEAASTELIRALQLLESALGTFESVSEDMTGVLSDAKALLDYLDGVDPIQLPAPGEDVSETANELYVYITDAEKELDGLNRDISSASESLTADIRAINDQFSKISDTIVDAIYHTENAASGDVVHDISETALASITAGKAISCTNDAYVEGDINIGGIVGSIAIENQLDPEDDLASSLSLYQYQSYELSAVVQSCRNTGTVVAKKDCVGGISGKMDLGLLIGCENYGRIESETGDYVGGIAGSSTAVIRGCFVKCTLSGGSFIGGILGCGTDETSSENGSTVSDCYSMVDIAKHRQHAGAVAGFYAGDFIQNFFVSDSLAGINRLSYSGQAEPISYRELVERSGISISSAELSILLPKELTKLSLCFVADGIVLKRLPIEYGSTLDESVYPSLPQKEGYYAHWDRETLENLRFDTVVSVVYTPYITAVASSELRETNRPIFFVEGNYDDLAVLSIQSEATTPGELGVFPQSFRDAFLGCFTGSALSREVIEQWTVVIPQDGAEVHTVRYLAPNGDPDDLQIYIRKDSGWAAAETWTVGSYLCFAVVGENAEIAVISTMPTWWVRAIAAVLTLLVIIVFLRLILRVVRGVKKHRMARKSKTVYTMAISESAPSDSASGTAATAIAAPAKRKKKKKIFCILIVLLVLAGILGGVYHLLVPELGENYKAYTMLKELTEKPQLVMSLDVEGKISDKDITINAGVERQQIDGRNVTAIESDTVKLYYADGVVFLENGKAYRISGSHPDQSRILEQVLELFRYVDVSAVDGSYTVTADGSNAAALLDILIPSAAGEFGDMQTISVELISENGSISEMRFSGSGCLANPQSTAYSLSAVLTVLANRTPVAIPAAVLDTMKAGVSEDIAVLTDDILRLANAWRDLDKQEQISTHVTLSADCGPVTVNDQLNLHFVTKNSRRIGVLEKGVVTLYFTGDSVCDERGISMGDDQAALMETVKLPELAYDIYMNSEADCTKNGTDSYLYTLQLDENAMKTVAVAIAPETAEMDLFFGSGNIEIVVADGKIRSLTLYCSGEVKLLVSSAEVTITADIHVDPSAAKVEIPDAVISAFTNGSSGQERASNGGWQI